MKNEAAQPDPLNRPLRIALVITELNVGGAERCLTRLAVGLDRRRYSPRVYSIGPRPAGEQASLVETLEQADVPLHFVGATAWWQFPLALFRMARQLKRDSPDVVQTFLFHANLLGFAAAKLAGVKAVSAGVRVAEPSQFRIWSEGKVLGRCQAVVCVSHAVADYCHKVVGLTKDRLVIIPNGVDLPDLSESRLVDKPKRTMVFIGRLDRQKGLDIIFPLLPEIFARLPNHSLLLVGDGPMKPELEAASRSLGVADRVTFAGWRPDASTLMEESDLLILPSRWEGMPNVLLEAMAAGLPVVASQAEGVSEVLGTGGEAQMFSLDHPQDFVSKVVTIASTPQRASILGSSNRQRVAAAFSWRQAISAYESLFDALATGGDLP